MTMHTPEPWHVEGQGEAFTIISENDTIICDVPWIEQSGEEALDSFGYANARRIAACVNACAGIPLEALEGGVVAEVIASLVRIADAETRMSGNNAIAGLADEARQTLAKLSAEG